MTFLEIYKKLTERRNGGDPYYVSFIEELRKLLTLTLRHQAVIAGIYPELTEDDVLKLSSAYGRLMEAANKFAENMEEDDPSRNEVMAVLENADRDRKGLANFKYRPGITLHEILEEAREKELHAPEGEEQQVGGNMSARIKLTDEKGTPIFFTASNTVKYPDEVMAEWKERAIKEHPEYQDAIEAMLNTKSAGREKNLMFQFAAAYVADKEFGEKLQKFDDKSAEDLYKILWPQFRELGKTLGKERAEQLKKDKGFYQLMHDFRMNDTPKIRSARAMEFNQIPKGSNIEKRNAAMSCVAQLMGLSDMLAYSGTASYEKDGKKISGIFMEKAEGLDVGAGDRPESDPEGFEKYKEEVKELSDISVWDTPEAKAQTADLQVLDYICGNTDRHGANMLYKFETDANGNKKLKKITGIDNDLSFGIWNGEYQDKGNFRVMQKPAGFGIMMRSTAMKILALDREALEFMLADKLEKAEINAAWERTQEMQKLINEAIQEERQAENGRRDPEREIKRGKILLCDPEDLNNISIEQLYKKTENKLFKNLMERADIGLRYRNIDMAKDFKEREGEGYEDWKWKGDERELYNARMISQEEKADLDRLRDIDEGEEKLKLSIKIIEQLTGQKITDEFGSYSRKAMEGLLDHVCLNGIPYRAAFHGSLDRPADCNQLISQMADFISEQMDERFEPVNNISLLYIDDNPMLPGLMQRALAYLPPEPVKVTAEKPGIFSSNKAEKQQEYERQTAEYEKALARKQMWEKRNEDADMETRRYRKTVKDGSVRKSFNEMADEFAHQQDTRKPRKAADEPQKEKVPGKK